MTAIGTIARACDVGAGATYHKVQWLACEACGAERWVWLRKGKPQSRWCYPCGRREGKPRGLPRGPGHWAWRGGRSVMKNGYIEVWLDEASPFFPMASKDGYVYEHRLVVAQHLGRCLTPDEEVHHRNGNKHDNALTNLELLSKGEHAARHHDDVMKLLQQIAVLEDQVRRLGGMPYEPQADSS